MSTRVKNEMTNTVYIGYDEREKTAYHVLKFSIERIATKHRFRPIIMTALTTIFGMIPLTWASSSSMGMSFKSFGFMLIGGMTSATLFTLLAVPVFYTLIDDAQKALRNIVATVFHNSPKPKFAK